MEKTKKMLQNTFFDTLHNENNKHKMKSVRRSVTEK